MDILQLIILLVVLSGAAVAAQLRQRRPRRSQSQRVLAAAADQRSLLSLVPKTPPDRAFADRAAKSGIYGLLLGTLGIEKSLNPAIRAFSEHLVVQNQGLIAGLTSIALRNEISLAKALDWDQQSMVRQLTQLWGSNFDDTFLDAVLLEGQKALQLFQREAQAGIDEALREFAADMIPKLRGQVLTGKRIQEKLDSAIHRGQA